MSSTVKILALGVIAAALFCTQAAAQSIAEFRRGLIIPNEPQGSYVRVTEHGAAANAVSAYGLSRPQSVPGLRICIFLSNSQTARQDAISVQESFCGMFPDIPAYLVYENPRFIVNVGNCLTEEEALILQNKVKGTFATAFIWRGGIPLDELTRETGKVLPAGELPAEI